MTEPVKAAARLAIVYAVAILAGWGAQRLGLPLPWMIGPLVSTAAISLNGRLVFKVPAQTRPFGQVTVAAQVGLYFSPVALTMVVTFAPMIVGMAVLTMVCAIVAATVLSRMSGLGVVPSMLATIPTSPVEAAVMAERYGIPPGGIIFAQTLRIALVVLLVPVAIYAIDGWPDRSGGQSVSAAFSPLHTVLLFGIASVAALVFRLLRISNPFFLGPLFASAACTAFGIEILPFHPVILAVAQIVLGTWLGSNFQRKLFAQAGRLTGAIICSGLLLLALCTLCALVLAFAFDLPWEELVLSAAPGGVTEMALTAKFLDQNVALITAFHLTRIFLLIPNIPWVVAWVHRRRGTT